MFVTGLILGGLVGAVLGRGFDGIVAGVLLGGVIGAVVKYAMRAQTATPAAAPAQDALSALAMRLTVVERRLQGLELAVHRLVDAAQPASAPADAPATDTGKVGVLAQTDGQGAGVTASDFQPELASELLPDLTPDGTPIGAPRATPDTAPPPMPAYGVPRAAAAAHAAQATEGMRQEAAPADADADETVQPARGSTAGMPPIAHAAAPVHPLWRWITGGNLLARIGAVVLFIGVAFLARYAVEHVTVPIELRLAGIALLGLGLLGFGWRVRHTRRSYALTLQGAGIGVLYLTVFAAIALYHLLPPALAFVLLVAFVAETGVLAVRQDALPLAVLATLGGFAAPVLVSTGSGNHVVLFTFYAVLDAGIFAIAWFRPWRALNVLGFLCTFVIATAWGVLRYRPEDFATTEPFLVLFFLFYVGIAVAYAVRRALEVRSPVDGMLVFGTPLVVAGLQASLVRPYEYGMSISAVAMAALYIGLAYALRRHRDRLRLLIDAFAALGLVFATLAIPLAVDARWTSATWALEGAALAWVGLRQQRLALRTFGVLLQFAAAIAFVRGVETGWTAALAEGTPLLDSRFIGGLLIAIAGIFTAWRYDAERAACRAGEGPVAPLMLAWGLLWWLGSGVAEVDRFAAREHAVALVVAWLGVTSALLLLLGRALAFERARVTSIATLPLLFALALGDAPGVSLQGGHLLAGFHALAWLFALTVGIAGARILEAQGRLSTRLLAAAHVALVWLAFILAAEECAWLVRAASEGATWRLASWLLVPAALTMALCTWRAPRMWPFARWRAAQVGPGLGVVVLVLVAVALAANFMNDGNAAPLPYVPVLNPLDLTFAAVALACVLWWREMRSSPRSWPFDNAWIGGAGAIAGFLWITMSTIRAIHHYADVPFNPDAAWTSGTVQAALALVWTTTALAAMVIANRRASRGAWIAGAALLGVVVVKLFVVDLAQVSGVARIVSFMGVGLLLLLIGYVAPVPARRTEAAA